MNEKPERLPGNVIIAGLLVAIAGGLIRLFSYSLAWPKTYSYTGPRESTEWAIKEAAYQEVSYALMALGVGLVIVGVHWLLELATVIRNGSYRPTTGSSRPKGAVGP